MKPPSILLIISGSIAAYKALELIRLLRKADIGVECILTRGGAEFITPLSVSSLSGTKTYMELFSLTDEEEMGHIQLSRKHDLVVVAPASANLIAQLVHGESPDLAATTLLATDKLVLLCPAMNSQMWQHAATQANLHTLQQRGVELVQPDAGALACGETGPGRMAEPQEILDSIQHRLAQRTALRGKKAIVTAGPTHEPLDPVRYLANRSSGKQGFAIAEALARAGADVTLISGPVGLASPLPSITLQAVQTAGEMLAACESALPADIFIGCAAVADWAPVPAASKLKKREDGTLPTITLRENPDILRTVANHAQRPQLVVGFAAETENLEANARAKRQRKNCDWLLANDVSEGKVFNSDETSLLFFNGVNDISTAWQGTKRQIASRLADEISMYLNNDSERLRP